MNMAVNQVSMNELAMRALGQTLGNVQVAISNLEKSGDTDVARFLREHIYVEPEMAWYLKPEGYDSGNQWSFGSKPF